MQAHAWYPQIDDLARDLRVIAVDMPGHGQSDALDASAGLQQFVQWAIDFIVALDIGPVNLAGHSMGLLIASGVAVTRPDLVKRVAVLNGVYRRTAEARQAVLQRAAELRSGTIDVDTPLRRWFNDEEAQRVAARKVGSWLKSVDLQGYATAYTAFAKGDESYADGWHEIACPALGRDLRVHVFRHLAGNDRRVYLRRGGGDHRRGGCDARDSDADRRVRLRTDSALSDQHHWP
ncbi:alpha/beta fold hydrolase [Caballeronia hypogeia]|uniref:alpha/beta fold hydrolase n=1 Tax=Caballeronia hypogeia TaxID=1777140 RepID=UPI000B27AE8C|nr:alpha/beta hydrolase [Caballeronia hypogeia]